MSLERMKEFMAGIVLVVLVIAALALALDAFQGDVGGCEGTDFWNATNRACYTNGTSTNVLTTGTNTQFNITNEGLKGVANASSYLDTIGTLIGVGALVAVVIATFYFVRR